MRNVVSVLVVVVMVVTTYVGAWYVLRGHPWIVWPHRKTVNELESIRTELEKHREVHGKYPNRLAELKETPDFRLGIDESGRVVDTWRTPYHYQIEGEGYTLFSYGQDRKLGGVGIDTDIYGRGRQDFLPTFHQFTLEDSRVTFFCVLTYAPGQAHPTPEPVRASKGWAGVAGWVDVGRCLMSAGI